MRFSCSSIKSAFDAFQLQQHDTFDAFQLQQQHERL